MAKDPETLGELLVAVQAAEKSLDNRIELTNRMLGLLATAFIAGGAGVFWLRSEMGAIRIEVTEIRKDTEAIKERLGHIETRTSELPALREEVTTGFSTLTSRLAAPSPAPNQVPFVPLTFDENEKQLIRKFMGNKQQPDVAPSAKVGDIVSPNATLLAVSYQLLRQVPKLTGSRLAIDEKNGSVLVVSVSDNRVLAII